MEFSEISIIGGIILILLLCAFIGFVKGLFKTGLALITLAGSGFAAWWGYNHATSYFSQWIPNQPEFMNVIYTGLGGIVVFCILYKIFSFISNPFESDDEKKGWGFGVPAAGISFLLHQFVMKKLESNKLGRLILDFDPLWNCDRENLTKAIVYYFQKGEQIEQEDEAAARLIKDPDFQNWIKDNSEEFIQAVQNRDSSQLWESDAVTAFLENPEWADKLEGFE